MGVAQREQRGAVKPRRLAVMVLTYFKRFRMEIDLTGRALVAPPLPAGYVLMPWEGALLKAHAEAKYRSFRHEIDANVFPCLGDRQGCLRLMADISSKEGFLPPATWLIRYDGGYRRQYCGTIQGIRDSANVGSIQNLGIMPEHRGMGLGTILMMHALAGFQAAGLVRAFLEVTAQNDSAIRLYQRLGFQKSRTVYKAVEVPTE